MKPTFCLTALLIFSFLGCKSQHYSFEELPPERIVFGNGGGITGASDTYVLLENGQLFHTNSLTKETIELEKISKKEAKKCFSKIDSLNLSKMEFEHPGNRYYFIEEIHGDEKVKVTWGSNDHEIDEGCKEFYKELMTTIQYND
ncbi:hypothetical protein [Maribacter halichondriae]|uniref:hypothetical protein n=1 Tax=Maribacter halichondriae TaxID=2980554 RepID=UPI0023596A7A|nr:hypothetical protein [Maribacter sp. Hal144]